MDLNRAQSYLINLTKAGWRDSNKWEKGIERERDTERGERKKVKER